MESRVGVRVRWFRERQGLSLRALAELCGLSGNTISLIERGETSPTVSSLHRLAGALHVPIAAFFQEEEDRLTVFVRRKQGFRYRGDGILVEGLGAGLRNQQLEVFSVAVEPGAGNMDDPIAHQGEEYVRCLEGQIEYCVGGHIYYMDSGDCLLFDATQPHCFRNTSPDLATILIVFQAGEEQDLARRQHVEVNDT